MSGKVKFTYFHLRGRGELDRFVLLAGNIDFEDDRINDEDWPALKPSTPAGQLPLITLPCGTVLNESLAIARYFAKKANLVGATDMENYYCDRALYTLEDLFKKFSLIYYEPDEQKKITMRADLVKDSLPGFLKILTKYLKETEGSFFIGDRPTFADLHLLNVLDKVDESNFEDFPEIIECRRKVLEMFPRLKHYREERNKGPTPPI